jgi:hypothetical protein
MQKLTRTSSGKNNKSCRFFTTNPTKLGLHFSDFLRFSTEFTRSSNSQTLLKLQLCSQPPGVSAGSQPCHYFAVKASESFLTSQCSPWGGGRRGSGQIPASWRPVSAGRGWEAAVRLPRPDSWSQLGSGRWPATGLRGSAGGVRLELGSGELLGRDFHTGGGAGSRRG